MQACRGLSARILTNRLAVGASVHLHGGGTAGEPEHAPLPQSHRVHDIGVGSVVNHVAGPRYEVSICLVVDIPRKRIPTNCTVILPVRAGESSTISRRDL